MAKSNSFNKREIEKKKQSKRLEKQQKKEERKASGISSFEDMIAYVDENGVITSTPPDPNKKKEDIELEDISISIPKRSEEEENQPLTGRVEFFDETKGFGFIKDKNSVNKYFFHRSNAPTDIKENNIVTFELERGQKGMNAINIQLVK